MSKHKPAKPSRLTVTPFPADARKAAVVELAQLRMRVTALERPRTIVAVDMADGHVPMNYNVGAMLRDLDRIAREHADRLHALESPRPSLWRRLTLAVGL